MRTRPPPTHCPRTAAMTSPRGPQEAPPEAERDGREPVIEVPEPGLVALCAGLVFRVDGFAPRTLRAAETDRRGDAIHLTEFDMPTAATRLTKRVPLRRPVLQHRFELHRPARRTTLQQTTFGVIRWPRRSPAATSTIITVPLTESHRSAVRDPPCQSSVRTHSWSKTPPPCMCSEGGRPCCP